METNQAFQFTPEMWQSYNWSIVFKFTFGPSYFPDRHWSEIQILRGINCKRYTKPDTSYMGKDRLHSTITIASGEMVQHELNWTPPKQRAVDFLRLGYAHGKALSGGKGIQSMWPGHLGFLIGSHPKEKQTSPISMTRGDGESWCPFKLAPYPPIGS